jgi:hypothetical protein
MAEEIVQVANIATAQALQTVKNAEANVQKLE